MANEASDPYSVVPKERLGNLKMQRLQAMLDRYEVGRPYQTWPSGGADLLSATAPKNQTALPCLCIGVPAGGLPNEPDSPSPRNALLPNCSPLHHAHRRARPSARPSAWPPR